MANRDGATRAWCIVCQYPGKDRFTMGTVFLRVAAPQHEIEAAGWEAIDKVLPNRPAIVDWKPGQVIFVAEEGDGL